MSFLTKSSGQAVARTESHESDFVDVLPNNTRVTASVDAAEWRSPSPDDLKKGPEWDVDHVNVTWRVQSGTFENRIIFHKMHVLSPDEKKRDNALDFYAATDTILNDGALVEMGEEPSDEELERVWSGKTADLVLGVWTMGKGADRKQGNFVKGIYPANSGGAVAGEARTRRSRSGEGAAQEQTAENAPRRRRRNA